MSLKNLQQLLVEQLHNLHDVEVQLVAALPQIIARVSSRRLRDALEYHLVETHVHVHRLELIFAELRIRRPGRLSKGMKGILEEAEELMSGKSNPAVLDAAIIAVCERIEHYEIACYSSTLAMAELLGNEVASRYLLQTAAEERVASRTIVSIAIDSVNDAADNAQVGA